jgi:hypothetical protein
MQKEFVQYELALRMKQLGFDEPCLNFYHVVGGFYTSCVYIESQEDIKELCDNGKQVLAPLFQQAFRWFREKYDLHHVIHHFTHKKGTDEAYLAEVGKADDIFSYCKTYEEAELACLEKLIEIVEEKLK